MIEFPVAALRSVDLVVPDLGAAERFYANAWGLAVAQRGPRSLHLHASGDDHHVLALHAGTAPAIRSITFRVANRAVLDHLAQAAPRHGGQVRSPASAWDDPGGGVGLVIADPHGRVLRFVADDARRSPGPQAQDRPTRLSHVNINSTTTDLDTRFFEQVLGFRLTDRSKLMAFVRCNSDHHAIVIADAAVNGLNHVAFMMPSLEGVMRGSGRVVGHGTPIAWGVGRHGPGDNVFAYFIDPSGIVVEYTAEVLQVDHAYVARSPQDWTWPPGRTDHWGIAPPKSERLKTAQQAILFETKDTAS